MQGRACQGGLFEIQGEMLLRSKQKMRTKIPHAQNGQPRSTSVECLMLLPSGPDMVHTEGSHGTQSSLQYGLNIIAHSQPNCKGNKHFYRTSFLIILNIKTFPVDIAWKAWYSFRVASATFFKLQTLNFKGSRHYCGKARENDRPGAGAPFSGSAAH